MNLLDTEDVKCKIGALQVNKQTNKQLKSYESIVSVSAHSP